MSRRAATWGTCIRDFIHVSDLAAAHVAALDHLLGRGDSVILNCGYGRGHSVREVLRSVECVAGRRLRVEPAPRRSGDAAEVVADCSGAWVGSHATTSSTG
jgi:UDP-glucose 4-epimerase